MWLDKQVSLYNCHSDNIGRPATYRTILLTQFLIPHNWWYYDNISYRGYGKDLDTIIQLKNLDRTASNYETRKKELKRILQCYTPAALLETKKKGSVKEITRTGIMQLDFDHAGIAQYDLEELKKTVFALRFIAFCGLSCSGDGFYALALIAEPHKLTQYAEHCFEVFLKHGIKLDNSKGKKVENLRYLSYDANMLIRDNPEPLLIKQKQAPEKPTQTYQGNFNKLVKQVQNATPGNRMQTIQRVAYTLGGFNNRSLLMEIKQMIKTASQYSDDEDNYLNCAEDCFKAGLEKPIK